MCACVCVIINLLIKTQTRTHKHTHTHMHRQASKHKQSHAMHTHTCKKYCKMRSPGAALYSPLPLPRFTSFLLFYFRALPQQQQNRTLDGTPNKCLNIYFYINRNIFLGFLVIYSFFLIVFIIHLLLCVRVSLVRWLSFHFCAARLLRFAPLSLSLSLFL